ncbi:MAG: RNA-binding protein [Rhodospirillaceae bacterium]|nr:RNA-binding protein [Rhodospirillaceae bacterium]
MLSVATNREKRPAGGRAPTAPTERRCLVGRQTLPVDQLVRFVIGPDNAIFPDVAQRLPGRGMWVQSTRQAVDEACRQNLFAKAAKAAVSADKGLADRVEQLLHRRCLDLIGLARRSGCAVAGFEKVKMLLAEGKAGVLLLGSDCGKDGSRKLLPVAKDVPVIDQFTCAELAHVFARERMAYGALASGTLAMRLISEARRFTGFREASAV